MLGWYGNFWDYWNLYHRVTFDGDNKIIIVNPGVEYLSVKDHIYSAWKEWAETYDYLKYEAAMRSVGGDPTVGSQKLGATFFLINGWKIRTWEGDQRLVVEGNLYSDDGQSAFLPVPGPYTITIQQQVSNLVDQLDNSEIAQLVWDEMSSQHLIPGSKGKEMRDTLKLIKLLVANI